MDRLLTCTLIAGLTVIALAACSQPEEPTAAPRPPLNVLIVMVDTLRADHMSTYGYERETTPWIDSLAARGVVFDRARSQASCTFPSVNSLLTSRWPTLFTRRGPGEMGIPDGVPSIAEILQHRGYSTVAVSASHIVRATPTEYNPGAGFDRGFDAFVEGCRWRDGECLNKKVFKQIETLEEPYFLYIHYMEPHSSYQPPAGHTRHFASDYQGHDFIAAGDPEPIGAMLYGDGPDLELDDRDIAHLMDLYDEEIRYFDGIFKQLMTRLEEQGLLENTVVVFTSDHGEEFLEHGQIKHCRGIWDTLSHVPLIFWGPGIKGGRHVATAVQNLDVVPTILDVLGIDSADAAFEGTSLRPLLAGNEPAAERMAFADGGRWKSADDGQFHLIFDVVENRATLFDVREDPLEQHDLFATNTPARQSLISNLDGWLKTTHHLVRLEEMAAEAKAKEEELRALGYLQ